MKTTTTVAIATLATLAAHVGTRLVDASILRNLAESEKQPRRPGTMDSSIEIRTREDRVRPHRSGHRSSRLFV